MKTTSSANEPTTSEQRARQYIDDVLARPSMYAGPSVQTFELVLLNLLNSWAISFEVDCDPRAILRKTYLDCFGHSAGAAGPAPKLIAVHGNNPDDPTIAAFYKRFAENVFWPEDK